MTLSQIPAPSSARMLTGVLHHFFRAMTGSYALSVILFLAARVMIGESNWDLLAFFNTFVHLLWIPAFVLLPVCLLLRDWQLSAMLLPPVFAFLFAYSIQFVPRAQPLPADAQPLSLLTYNLHAAEPQSVLDVIRASDADLVALQQVSPELVPLLQTAFSAQYPDMILPADPTSAGQVILSRLPIIITPDTPAAAENALAVQRAEVRFSDQHTVTLYNVAALLPRAGFPFPLPERDLQSLLALPPAEPYPVLMVGTFNVTDQHDAYAAMTASLRDAFREVGQGMGWTYPAGFPLLRTDYLFYSEHWTAHTAHVLLEHAAGRHAPVRVVLTLRG